MWSSIQPVKVVKPVELNASTEKSPFSPLCLWLRRRSGVPVKMAWMPLPLGEYSA